MASFTFPIAYTKRASLANLQEFIKYEKGNINNPKEKDQKEVSKNSFEIVRTCDGKFPVAKNIDKERVILIIGMSHNGGIHPVGNNAVGILRLPIGSEDTGRFEKIDQVINIISNIIITGSINCYCIGECDKLQLVPSPFCPKSYIETRLRKFISIKADKITFFLPKDLQLKTPEVETDNDELVSNTYSGKARFSEIGFNQSFNPYAIIDATFPKYPRTNFNGCTIYRKYAHPNVIECKDGEIYPIKFTLYKNAKYIVAGIAITMFAILAAYNFR